MKLLNPIPIGVNIAIKNVSNMFGVEAEIYRLKYVNETYGVYSDDVVYEDTPYYSGVVLVPALFKQKSKSQTIVNDLLDEEFELYITSDMHLDRYSLVDLKLNNNKIEKFVIDDILEYNDNEQVLFRKYKIIPYTKVSEKDLDILDDNQIQIVNNQYNDIPNDVRDFLNDLLYQENTGKDIRTDLKDDTKDNYPEDYKENTKPKNTFVYKPIE